MSRLWPRIFVAGLTCVLAACQPQTDSTPRATSEPTLPHVTVGANVLVSGANALRAHDEMYLSADPTDPNHLLACGSAATYPRGFRYAFSTVVYATFDGGKTWRPQLDLPPFSSDPSCLLGPSGQAFVGAIAGKMHADNTSAYTGMYAWRSGDYGRHWSRVLWVPGPGDRDYFAVDLSPASRYKGHVYFHFSRFVKPLETLKPGDTDQEAFHFYRSADGGRSFAAAATTKPQNAMFQTGQSVILRNGTLIAEYHLAAPALTPIPLIAYSNVQPPPVKSDIFAAVSVDGGATVRQYHVSDWITRVYDVSAPQALSLPTVAADMTHGPYHDRAYFAWTDSRFGQSHILLAHSDDGGKTWSRPIVVDDVEVNGAESVNYGAFMPAVAVNRNGIVSVIWFDRRGISDGVGSWMRFAYSIDGGETFSPSIVPSTAANLVEPTRQFYLDGQTCGGAQPACGDWPAASKQPLQASLEAGNYVMPVNTVGFVADAGGTFHALWANDRTGVSQMWTVPITVDERAIANGDPSLVGMRDVTSSLILQMGNAVYDRDNGTVSLDVSLKQLAGPAIRGPITLRVISLHSPLGPIALTTSDNGRSGPGALLAFSGMRRLTFHIDRRRDAPVYPNVGPEAYVTIAALAYAK